MQLCFQLWCRCWDRRMHWIDSMTNMPVSLFRNRISEVNAQQTIKGDPWDLSIREESEWHSSKKNNIPSTRDYTRLYTRDNIKEDERLGTETKSKADFSISREFLRFKRRRNLVLHSLHGISSLGYAVSSHESFVVLAVCFYSSWLQSIFTIFFISLPFDLFIHFLQKGSQMEEKFKVSNTGREKGSWGIWLTFASLRFKTNSSKWTR